MASKLLVLRDFGLRTGIERGAHAKRRCGPLQASARARVRELLRDLRGDPSPALRWIMTHVVLLSPWDSCLAMGDTLDRLPETF